MKKIIAFFVAIFLPLVSLAVEHITVLSDEDAALYSQIFVLQDKEKIESAKKLEAKLKDKSLMNEVLYQRYVSKTYRTRGAELQDWMNKYYDMPGADRMAKIAKIKQASVRKPFIPSIMTGKDYIETAHIQI